MDLNTLEKFLLIAQHPTKGRFMISDIHINYGVIGAALLDMSVDKLIELDGNRLILKSSSGVSDPVISEILSVIKKSKKVKKIKWWISKLVHKSKRYKWNVLNKLSDQKRIRIEKRRFLGLIPYKKCFLIDHNIRENLIFRLKEAILYKKELNEESISILGLIEACDMYKIISKDRDERKKLKKELKKIVSDSSISKAISITTQQIQSAIISIIIASTVATTVASNN